MGCGAQSTAGGAGIALATGSDKDRPWVGTIGRGAQSTVGSAGIGLGTEIADAAGYPCCT